MNKRNKKDIAWEHNGHIGRTHMIHNQAETIYHSSSVNQRAKDICIRIQALAHELADELKKERIDS